MNVLDLNFLAATDPDYIGQVIQLGLGSLIAGPVFYLWRDERKARIAAEARERDSYKATTPLLIEVTSCLKDVRDGLEAKASTSKRLPDYNQLDKSVRRLELLVEKALEVKNGE